MAAAPSHSLIFFIFEDDLVDDPLHPNKIILDRADPTVSDDVAISCSFLIDGTRAEFASDSTRPVPVDDRHNVISVKISPSEGAGKLFSPAAIALSSWLTSCHLEPLIEPLLKHRVTLDLLKFVKDVDLVNMGVRDVEHRMALLEALSHRSS